MAITPQEEITSAPKTASRYLGVLGAVFIWYTYSKMNLWWVRDKQTGFTIVELLIVIVIIGILAAIVVVAYSGIQARALDTAAKSSLAQAAQSMELIKTTTGSYPTTLPDTIHSTNGITISLVVSSLPYYPGINAVQNGELVAQICQDLINEGLGNGTNQGGGTDPYITGCGDWNNNGMQVTGWSSQVFNTPVSNTAFTDYAASVPAADSYHPNEQSTIRNFFTQLNSRFQAEGGTYPITSFWDSWATPGNGVVYQDLPTPQTGNDGSSYCLQATATNGKTWIARPGSQPASGAC